MTHLFDLDVLRPDDPLPMVWGPAKVLVRAGNEVLGEVDLPWYAPLDELDVRASVLDRFGLRLVSADEVRVASPSSGVVPAAVSVVVLASGDDGAAGACAATLAAADPQAGDVVVVGGTADGRASDRDPVAERNDGWRATTGDVVAFLDDGARVPAGFVAAVGRAFAADGIGVVLGPAVAAELASPAQHAFEAHHAPARTFRRSLLVPHRHDGGIPAVWQHPATNLVVRRTVLEQVGGFRTTVGGIVGEGAGRAAELDLVQRILASGGAALYDPSTLVRWVAPRDWGGVLAATGAGGARYGSCLSPRGRLRWQGRRHVAGVAQALVHRRPARASLLLAEAVGARRTASRGPR